MSVIRKFIEENKISFAEGQRNSSIVTLIGYSLYLGMNQEDLENELLEEAKQDVFIENEIERLWNFCKNKNYGNWWENEKNRKTFII